jgi:4a-hydroxytetrahydrobiopterin dehydratase
MAERIDVTLYTRQGCHLCEQARKAIDSAARKHALPMSLREVDIDFDLELLRRYANDVPVVAIGGDEVFRHRVDPEEFAVAVRTRMRRARSGRGTSARSRAGAGAPVSNVSSLVSEKCVPCRGGVSPLKGDELAALGRELGSSWRIVEEHHLEKEFSFPDFAKALEFTNRVGAIAEAEGHHPDIYLAWGKVRVTIWTHKIDGLTRSDFVLGAKIGRIQSAES